jgi:DnaJ-class molecular chaperone
MITAIVHQTGPGPGIADLAVAAAFAWAGWRISLRIHPWTRCSTCKGDPRSYGALYKASFALCPACGGTGRQLRRGAKDPDS